MLIDYKEYYVPFATVEGEIKNYMQKRKKNIVFQKMKNIYTSRPEMVVKEELLFNSF